MSTMVTPASAPKKLSSRVRPGVLEVRASTFWPVRALISGALPTLERPAKATSMPIGGGRDAIEMLGFLREKETPARPPSAEIGD